MSIFKKQTPSSFIEEGNYILIDVHINNIDHFYNYLDPSPEDEKDLDEETEAYIREAVEDLTLEEREHAKIVLYLSDLLYDNMKRRENMEKAVNANFAYRLTHEERKYKFALERGKRYLVRGLFFLVICVFLSTVLPRLILENDINLAFAQSFVVIGWVALWKPVEFYLYDRRDLLDDLDVLNTLSCIPVESRRWTEYPKVKNTRV